MNVSWPGATDDDAWNEAPVPEQYQHTIDANGKVTCDVSDLYSHQPRDDLNINTTLSKNEIYITCIKEHDYNFEMK